MHTYKPLKVIVIGLARLPSPIILRSLPPFQTIRLLKYRILLISNTYRPLRVIVIGLT